MYTKRDIADIFKQKKRNEIVSPGFINSNCRNILHMFELLLQHFILRTNKQVATATANLRLHFSFFNL